MNRHEYLATCIMEEAAELIQITSKGLRFGFDDMEPGATNRNNFDNFILEWADLNACVVKFLDEFYLDKMSQMDDDAMSGLVEKKNAKVDRMYAYSKSRGTINES